MFVTGLVLAAGSSDRMGRPKQLLPFRGETLLDATLQTARACDFDQLVVTLGGVADQIRERVDLVGVDIAENPAFGTGCSSSIARALSDVDARAGGIVLMLGDQPNVSPDSARALVAASGPPPSASAAIGTVSGTRFGSAGTSSTTSPVCTETRVSGSYSSPAATR